MPIIARNAPDKARKTRPAAGRAGFECQLGGDMDMNSANARGLQILAMHYGLAELHANMIADIALGGRGHG